MVIYTDGSYSKKHPNVCGFGAFLLEEEDANVMTGFALSGGTSIPMYTASNNVGGEVYAVIAALKWALENAEYDQYLICHDYTGVAHWALGSWARNKDLTKQYHELMQGYMRQVRIGFNHVRGHSGIVGNEVADDLANKGAAAFINRDDKSCDTIIKVEPISVMV